MAKIERNMSFSNCLKAGITVYPVYFPKEKKIGKNTYLENNWYIQVNNNGKIKTYHKSIGAGTTLKSHEQKGKGQRGKIKEWCKSIDKVLDYWNELLKKNNINNEKTE